MHATTVLVAGAASVAIALSCQACSQSPEFGGPSGGSSAASSGAGEIGGSDEAGGAGGEGGATTTPTTTESETGGGGSAPATCNGYEPCGVNPVVIPDGYTLGWPGITVFNQATNTSCADFADCDMWNTHFDAMWSGGGDGYNRMGSPFPWPLSRYIVSVPPKRITYAKLHMTAPNEEYVYSDGTPETRTDPSTHAVTCYQRGPGHLMLGYLGNMGGTGNAGFVDWNISVLPGDMGDSGNASTCHGSGATTWILITSDEATAATMGPSGKFDHCLLREGQDYYVNFMSYGHPYAIDCSTDDCTIGTFAFSNPTTSDGSPFLNQVPCP